MMPTNSDIRRRKTNKMIYIWLFILFVITGTGAISAQVNSLQNSVYGDDSERPAPKKKATTGKTGEARNAAANRSNANRVAPKTKRDLQMVTFVTREAQSEIWLNDRILGQTDGEKKLSRKLVTGEYRVMVKKNNRVLVPSQKIVVNTENTVFNLFSADSASPKISGGTTAVTPVNTQKIDLKTAVEGGAKIKKILDDYADPATTDSVTPEDWEAVFQAAQLGQFQDFTAVQIEAQRWFASGQIELAKGNYPNAYTAFTKSEEYMPQSGLPFLGLGNAYLANKQTSEAIKAYQKALQLNPKLALAYRKLGDAQKTSGKEKEAAAAYRAAIDNGYKTPETRYLLASLLLDGKHPEEAIKQLEEVSKEWEKPEVFTSIGDGYESLKRDVSAIAAYQKAIELDSKYAPAYYKLGNVYFDQREFQKAKDAFQKAADLDPEGKVTNRADVQKKLRESASKIK